MGSKPNRSVTGRRGPNPSYSTSETLAASALLGAVVVGTLLVVSYPVAAAAALAVAIAARLVVRALLRYRTVRRREGRTRRVCVPNTDICLEA